MDWESAKENRSVIVFILRHDHMETVDGDGGCGRMLGVDELLGDR